MTTTGDDSRHDAARRDPYQVPHRKNAAEWVMWVALLPLVPIALVIERLRHARGRRHG